jgi:hypothetical protein
MFLADDESVLSAEECRNIINVHIIQKKLKEPNFYLIENFVNFMNDQLVRLESSSYFRPEYLID